MKKAVGVTLAGLVALCLLLGTLTSTWALFNDPETSGNDQVIAGTLDLKTNDVDGVSQTLYATNLQPNNSVGPSTIQLKNAGTMNGSTLDITFTYAESDGSPNSVNKSADDTAAMMEVTVLSYNGSSLLSSVVDANVNGYKDVQDLKNSNLTGLSGLNASQTKSFQIAVQLRSSVGSDYDADGINLTMTFTLNQ
jgi:hypothetical protein